MTKKIVNFLFEDKSPFNLLCCLLWGIVLLNYIAAAFRHFATIIPDNKYVTCFIIFFTAFISLPQIIKRLSVYDLLFYISCVFVYLLQYFLFPNNYEPLNEFAVQCCLLVFPFYFFGKMVDIPKMLKPFYCISVATVGMFIFYYILYGAGSSQVNTEDYNMGAAYQLLPHVLIVLWITIREPSPLRICIAFVSVVLLLMFGTRGPILSLILPLAVYILFFYHGSHAKALRVSFIAVAIVVLLSLISLAIYLQNIFDYFDVNSRILQKLIAEDITNDSGRGDLIVELNKHLFAESRIFGYGLFGSYQYIGGYPHNIFYELIFSFGFVFGSILIILMLRHFVLGYRNIMDNITKEFILLFTLMELTHLFLSYTFLTEQMFFFLLGLCAQRNKRANEIAIQPPK